MVNDIRRLIHRQVTTLDRPETTAVQDCPESDGYRGGGEAVRESTRGLQELNVGGGGGEAVGQAKRPRAAPLKLLKLELQALPWSHRGGLLGDMARLVLRSRPPAGDLNC